MLTVKKTFTLCYIENKFRFQNMKFQQQKNQCQYLYKKDDEIKGGNITDENKGIIEYGNDYINCKIIHSNQ